MKSKVFKSKILIPLMLCIIAFAGVSCKKSPILENTSEDVNITGYLDKHPDQFSEFRKIMEISETSGFLQAWGAYTIFLPTNDAVKAYLKEKGIASVDQISKEDLEGIVTLHVVEDSIKTTDFYDGKLRNATMYGQYIVTGAINEGNVSKIRINNQANLITGNISVGNGIIHIIDNVLKPAELTVAQTIEANPENSIFTQALKATGFYDRLNIRPKDNPKVTEKYLTVFAETNTALKAAGFDTYEELFARYCNTGNPTNPADSLNLYVGYHITPQALYFVDIINPVKLPTFSIVSISTLGKGDSEVVINEIEFDGKLEPGAPLPRTSSDITASNGVVHYMQKHYALVKRSPTALYWDVADQPEFRKLPQWRKSQADMWDLGTKPVLQFIKWDRKGIQYKGGHGTNVYWGDVLRTPLVAPDAGSANTPNRPNYIEFITPYVVPGRYKLWVCYPKAGRGGPMAFWFNGKKLNRIVDLFVESKTEGMTDDEREQLGWKKYIGPVTTNANTSMGRLLGTVEVTSEGAQIIRMENTGGSYHNDYYIDMFHLIPESQDQLWPRFWANGRVQQKGEPD